MFTKQISMKHLTKQPLLYHSYKFNDYLFVQLYILLFYISILLGRNGSKYIETRCDSYIRLCLLPGAVCAFSGAVGHAMD